MSEDHHREMLTINVTTNEKEDYSQNLSIGGTFWFVNLEMLARYWANIKSKGTDYTTTHCSSVNK